ncbi:hypothetical protein A4L73_28400, partial [Salmonella enterica subsp. enterica serovar Enteritidis]|nr:hypothetical protein [Salmonella enterica subsp. enterica serovar Enteritidis]
LGWAGLPEARRAGSGNAIGLMSNRAGTPLDCAVMASNDCSVFASVAGGSFCAAMTGRVMGKIKKKGVSS